MIHFQDIPQVLIQVAYLSLFTVDTVAATSAAFTVMSIMVTALTMLTQRMVMKNESLMMIQLDVRGEGISAGMELKMSFVQEKIASVLKVPVRAVAIEQGQFLNEGGVSGFCFKIEVDIDGVSTDDVMFEGLIQSAIDNGNLAEAFHDQWKLPALPTVGGLKCTVQRGKEVEMSRMTSGRPTTYSVNSKSADFTEGRTSTTTTES